MKFNIIKIIGFKIRRNDLVTNLSSKNRLPRPVIELIICLLWFILAANVP